MQSIMADYCLCFLIICVTLVTCPISSIQDNPCPRADDFKCQNGDCITSSLRCNGHHDCSDKSDEASSMCALKEVGDSASAENEDYSTVCMDKLREQIQKEVSASIKYLVMGAYFNRDSVNRPGIAKFFFESASEERGHAMKMMEYLNMRGDTIDNFQHKIDVVDLEWKDSVHALADALRMEKEVTDNIKGIAIYCMEAEEEHLADYLISDFLTEQLEGQRILAGYINRIQKLGTRQSQLKEFLFDEMLLKEGSFHSSA